ncbi:hypothetical protein ACEZCY_14175 [Streptacidiphilus sp. N1-12]|uniref:Uncharacterized protein n=2 Tax=Streptacidiphilus alkalitolerans TaxID=3342712 RepID=A0ABV6V9J8_9ACTN
MRVTRLDACGVPVIGACSTIVSAGFVSIAYSPEIEKADEILVKAASGAICVNDPGINQTKWFNAEATFCGVDPDMVNMMTGNALVLDALGSAAGYRVASGSPLANFGLEVWADISGQTCGPGVAREYGYFLLPYVTQGYVNDFKIENDAASFVITGARTKDGSGWGVGPYDVDDTSIISGTVTPGPLLTAIGPRDHLDLHKTTIAPPAVTAGCVALAAPA